MSMPRLSVDLPHKRALGICQACGLPGISIWQEHDEHDKPELIFVSLCEECADVLIEPHLRLYARRNRNSAMPGAMECCVGCRHELELGCTNNQMKFNGGPGVVIREQVASRGFACSRGKGCRSVVSYSGPATCEGREPA